MWPRATFLRSTFYNEFLEPFDTCQMACIGALGVEGRFEALSIYRGPSENSFSDEVIGNLKSLIPHVQTALNLRRQLSTLEERVSDLEASLHAISTAVVLIDAKSQCTFLNQAAQRLIDHNDGLVFGKRELCAQDVRESARLREILSAVSCASLTSRSARSRYVHFSKRTPSSQPGRGPATGGLYFRKDDCIGHRPYSRP